MHVSLTPELEAIVQGKVKSGFYSNASEVIRDAIRRLHERDSESERLARALSVGLEDIENGRTVPYDMDAIKAKAQKDHKRGIPVGADVQD